VPVATKPDPLQPNRAHVIRVQRLPLEINLFQLRFEDEELNLSFDFKPGQFLMLSVIGVGEAPFAIVSSPSRRGLIEIAVRQSGRVTTALHNLKENALIGIRGPYGNGYPIERMRRSDVLLLSEGPWFGALRSLRWYILDNRKDFGQVTLVATADDAKDLPFGDELSWLGDREDITCRVCRPAARDAEGQDHMARLIAGLRQTKFVAQGTYAVLAGEPAHFPPLWDYLLERGVSKDKILFSLQRKMRCGIGKCGHCSIGYKYTCLDGPVFSYWDAQNLPEVI
jgi:NAD(P)H-flavin reductase